MEFSEFIEKLSVELTLPLPGKDVQLKMSSTMRIRELMDITHPNAAINSSVLILLYPRKRDRLPAFAVILRPEYNGIHSGQISLPGGRYEISDENLLQTALRETQEEIGIDPREIKVIGRLTELYIPPSNYLVQPFVGFMDSFPKFRSQPEEVDEIIEIPVHKLLDENNRTVNKFNVRGIHFSAPSYVIGGKIIWGATAMILSEFKEMIKGMTL